LACGMAVLAAPLRAEQTSRDRVAKYFEGWYSVCPGTQISVSPAPEMVVPGYETYKVERRCYAKNRNEASVTLVDRARDELFVGEVLFNLDRRNQPFTPASDLPVLRATLQSTYGLPVALRVGADTRGSLIPLVMTLRLAEGALPSLPGFVSQDGAALLVGQFHPFAVPPEQWRDAALGQSQGVRAGKGDYTVTAFIDFQCEKCRQREPQVRDFVTAHGGAMEIRFLPLVKVHNWAFAAAESAAALAGVSPALYARYEDAIFPRAATMTEAAARELAADVADAAGSREAFDSEIASGRARGRVARDVELALRLGLNSTPVFFYRGAFLTSDPNLAESFIQSKLGGGAHGPEPGSPR